METVALVIATLAAAGVLALAIRACYLARQAQRAVESLRRCIEEEITPAVRAWREAGHQVREAARRVEASGATLASLLERVDRVAERFEPDSLVQTVIGPALAKAAAWVVGFRRGMASVTSARADCAEEPDD